MFRKTLGAVLVIAILVGGGYLAYNHLLGQPEEAEGTVYATEDLHKGDLSITIEDSGNLNPQRTENIQAEADGVLEQIKIQQGDSVEEGQLLAQISSEELESEISEKETELERAIEELAATLDVQEDQVLDMDPNQGINVTAPIDGRIQNIAAREDEQIERASSVAKIVDDSHVLIEGEFTPTQFEEIEEDMKVQLNPEDFADTVEGTVYDANPTPIPQDDHYIHEVTVKAENPGLLQPGHELDIIVSDSTTIIDAVVDRYYDETTVWSPAEGTVVDIPTREWQSVEEGDSILQLGGSDTRDFIYNEQIKIEDMMRKLEDKKQLKDSLEITSPIDGMVGHMINDGAEGNDVSDGQNIANIVDTSSMTVTLEVDEVDIVHLDQGMEAEVTVDAFPGDMFPAEVTYLDMMGQDEEGVTVYQVEIEVMETNQINPGMTGDVSIFVDEAQDVLLAPVEAIYTEGEQAMVDVLVDDEHVETREVEIGLIGSRYAEIESGLEKGDTVITGTDEDLLDMEELDDDTQPSIIPQGQ